MHTGTQNLHYHPAGRRKSHEIQGHNEEFRTSVQSGLVIFINELGLCGRSNKQLCQTPQFNFPLVGRCSNNNAGRSSTR